MKILMLVPFIPNTAMSGGQTRWYNIIKLLSKKHDITLFTLIKDDTERQFVLELEKYCVKVKVFYRSKSPWTFRNLILTAFSHYPLLVIRNYSPSVKRAIARELDREKYDLIHAETFYVMPHIPKTSVPTILVEQTIEYQVYKHYVDHEIPRVLRLIYMVDVMKLKFWEQYYWRKTDQLVAVSDEDKKTMQKLSPGISVDIIPNGVDAHHFANHKARKKSPPRVLYGVANFKWLQNVEAVDILLDKVWPSVHALVPKAKLWIVGRLIPERFVKLARKRTDVEITESIPDARDAFKKASVMVVPVKGPGGTRLKVFEAMAAGLPVVTTRVGGAGIDLLHGVNVMVADSTEGLAEHTVTLLKDKKLAAKIAKNGQRFVKQHFDWNVIVKLHDDVYRKALK